MRRHGLWLVLTILTGVAQADEEIYRRQGADGPSYSDRPEAGSKPVELPPVNTVPAPPAPTPALPESRDGSVARYRVALDAPTTVPNGLVPTPVGIDVQPALRSGHRWRLLLDGDVVAEGEGGSHTLGSLSRGPHRLLLQVVDGSGNVLGSDGPVELFVLRPGKN